MRAWKAYRPQPAQLPLTVIRARDSYASKTRDFIDWTALGGGTAVTVAGDHLSLLRPPHVAAVGALVEAAPDPLYKLGRLDRPDSRGIP
jgi:thioesterase domain-containing protein